MTKRNTLAVLVMAALLPLSARAQQGDTKLSDQLAAHGISEAGFMVEPIISVGQSNSSIRTSQTGFLNDTSGRIQSLGLGGRVGFHVMDIFLVGVDARYARSRFQDSGLSQTEGNALNVGPMIGVQTPFYGVRLAATYVADGFFDPGANGQGLDTRFTTQRGYRLGAGLKLMNVNIGLEYEKTRYENSEIQSWGALNVAQNSAIDLDNEGVNLNLTFPIEF